MQIQTEATTTNSYPNEGSRTNIIIGKFPIGAPVNPVIQSNLNSNQQTGMLHFWILECQMTHKMYTSQNVYLLR